MSIKTTQSLALNSKHIKVVNPSALVVNPIITDTTTPWTRPADWLTLPTLTTADQKFVGLHMVMEGGFYCALSATGNYTVDWGDGNIINYATGVTAEHQYDFANVNLGAATSEGWKQAVVTVTPQAGQNLTTLNLHIKHSAMAAGAVNVLPNSGFVDIAIAGSLLNSLTLGSSSIGSSARTISFRKLKQVNIVKSAITNMSYLFHYCQSLVSVVGIDAACTNTSNMFQNCYLLQTVPLFNLAACTITATMFYNCYSLQTVPLFNLAVCINTSNMFSGCSSLQTVPLFNLVSCQSASSMFYDCSSLQTVPLFNLGVCIAVSNMFSGCSTLQAIPLFNLTTATTGNTINMFHNCNSLTKGTTLNLKYSTSYNDCNLSPTALNDIYTNLGTATAQTITVTGNWGTTSDDPTIATAKGWTVTG